MCCALTTALVLLTGFLPPVAARIQPPKPAPLPAVNPAVAHLEQTATGLDGPAMALAVNEEVGLLVVGCEGHTLRYWVRDANKGWQLAATPHVLKGHQAPVTAVAAAGKTLASAGADGKVILWAVPGDRPLHTLSPAGAVRALALSPDGKVLAGGGDDPAVQLWDAATGKPTRKLPGATDWLLALAFSPDGKQVAAGGYDGRLRVWDVASGRQLFDVLAQPPAPPKAPPPPVNVVSAIAFSPAGVPGPSLVAVGGSDPRIHLFQAADGKLVRSLQGHTGTISGLAFHPGGSLLASASKDRTLRLWNPAGGQMLKSLEGHTAWAQGVAFLDRGTRLASAGADQTVRLWGLTEPPKKK
jgi:WD40 repeat protein